MTGLLDRMAALVLSEVFRSGGCDLRVLFILLLHADSKGVAWPSVSTIAEHSNMEPRRVKRAIRRLKKTGEIRPLTENRGGRGKTTRYEVLPQARDGLIKDVLLRNGGYGDHRLPQAVTQNGGRYEQETVVTATTRTHQEHTTNTPYIPTDGSKEGEGSVPGEGVTGIPEGELVGRQAEAMALLTEKSMRLGNTFKVRRLLCEAICAGLEQSDLRVLIEQAAGRRDLFWHWLGDVNLWKSVIADGSGTGSCADETPR